MIGVATVVGREEELARAREALRESSVLVLRGEAGIGKTALWEALIEAERAAGSLVLAARASAAEARMSFAVLGDLLGPVRDIALDRLEGPARRALAAALDADDFVVADPRTVGLALVASLRSFADERRVVVAIDDVQWVDAASAAPLTFLVRRIGATGAVMLVTHRGADGSPLPLELDRTAAVVSVPPLSPGAIGVLLRERVAGDLSRASVLRIAEVSGGNPLYALELGRSVDRDRNVRVPPSLTALVEARLTALSAATRQALLVAAASASPPTLALLEAILEGDVDIDDAVEEGVVRVDGVTVHFTHPLFAATVYGDASPGARRAVHRRLARAVAAPEERARHRALAAAGPDAAVADELEAAADAAFERGAVDAAIELGRRAAELTPATSRDAQVRRLVAVAERALEAGDVVVAIDAAQRVLEAPAAPPDSLARALVVRGEVAFKRNDADGGFAAFDAARTAAGPALAARIEARRAIVLSVRSDLKAEDCAREALELAEASGDIEALVVAASVFGRITFNRGHGIRPVIERAVDAERARGAGYDARAALLHQVCWSGQFARARSLADEIRRYCRERGLISFTDVNWYQSVVELLAGRWDDAERLAEAAIARCDEIGAPFERFAASGLLAFIAARRGESDRALETAKAALASMEGGDLPTTAVFARGALGVAARTVGDTPVAVESLVGCAGIFERARVEEPGMWFFASDLVAALADAGDLQGLVARLEPYERRAAALGRTSARGIAARARGLVAAAEGAAEAAEAAFARAVAEHERAGQPYELAASLAAAGRFDRRSGRRSRARERLTRAAELAETIGARAVAAEVRAELARVPGRARRATNLLTPSEERVAALVASGRTNAEVARQLFVTENTVERHLSRVYAKLGVRSRTELANRLAS